MWAGVFADDFINQGFTNLGEGGWEVEKNQRVRETGGCVFVRDCLLKQNDKAGC